MNKLTADKKGKFTHEYVGEMIGNDPFILHEEKFDALNENLVKELGEEYEHSLSDSDGYGNVQYVSIVESRTDEIEDGMLEMYFDDDGVYTPLSAHLFRVVGDAVEFVE